MDGDVQLTFISPMTEFITCELQYFFKIMQLNQNARKVLIYALASRKPNTSIVEIDPPGIKEQFNISDTSVSLAKKELVSKGIIIPLKEYGINTYSLPTDLIVYGKLQELILSFFDECKIKPPKRLSNLSSINLSGKQ